MGFSFNRQSLSLRRAGAPGVIPEGSIALSETLIETSALEGDGPTELEETIVLTGGGPGIIANPSLAVAYSGATGWLTVVPEVGSGQVTYRFFVDATSLTTGAEIATLTYTADNASNSGAQATILLQVVAVAPSLDLQPPSLALSIVDETASGTAKTVAISNGAAGGTLATPTVGTITGDGEPYILSANITGTDPWTLTVTPTATNGTAGVYTAIIPILSTGASNSGVTVTVVVSVTSAGAAVIALDRSLDDAKGTVGGANPAPVVVGVTSANPNTALAGPAVESVTYTGNFGGWLTPAFGGPSGRTLTSAIDISNIGVDGVATATVKITDAAATDPEYYDVLLRMGAQATPATLAVSPSAISKTVQEGGNTSPATVQIVNSGSGGLAALGVLGASWVSAPAWAALAIDASTGVITITFSASAQTAGSYAATMQVSATLPSPQTRNVTVQLVVQAATGAYAAPAWTLPSYIAHDTGTDLLSGEPFAVPAIGSFS